MVTNMKHSNDKIKLTTGMEKLNVFTLTAVMFPMMSIFCAQAQVKDYKNILNSSKAKNIESSNTTLYKPVSKFLKLFSDNSKVKSEVSIRDFESKAFNYDSNESERILSYRSEQIESRMMKQMTSMLWKSFVGDLEEEIKNKYLSISTSSTPFESDEEDQSLSVSSYGLKEYNLLVDSNNEKNSLTKKSSSVKGLSVVASSEKEVKGTLKIRPNFSSGGLTLQYDKGNFQFASTLGVEGTDFSFSKKIQLLNLSFKYSYNVNSNESELELKRSLFIKEINFQFNAKQDGYNPLVNDFQTSYVLTYSKAF